MPKPNIKWTANLDLEYCNKNNIENKNKKIPGNKIHWYLSLAVRNVADSYLAENEKTDYFKGNSGDECKIPGNFLAASIGFIVSDKECKENDHSHGRKFIHWPILDLRQVNIDSSIEDRKEYCNSIKKYYPEKKLDIDELVNKKKWEGYLHTEDFLFYHLEQEGIKTGIIERLKKEGINPGFKIYAIVLDFHSSRYVCQNKCEELIYGMQGLEDHSFRKIISDQLKKEGYILPSKHTKYPRMITRVSADMKNTDINTKTLEELRSIDLKEAEEKNESNGRDIQMLANKNSIIERHDHEVLLTHLGFFDKKIARKELPEYIFGSQAKGIKKYTSKPNHPPEVSLASLWFRPKEDFKLSTQSITEDDLSRDVTKSNNNHDSNIEDKSSVNIVSSQAHLKAP